MSSRGQDLYDSNIALLFYLFRSSLFFFLCCYCCSCNLCAHYTADAIYPTILVLFVVLFIVRLAECHEQFGKQSNRSAMEKNKLVHLLNTTELKSRSLKYLYISVFIVYIAKRDTTPRKALTVGALHGRTLKGWK